MTDLTEQPDRKPPDSSADRRRRSPTATSAPTPSSRPRCWPRSGYDSLDELVADAVPAPIRHAEPLDLPAAGLRGRGARRAAPRWPAATGSSRR